MSTRTAIHDRGTAQEYLLHFALAPRLEAKKGGARVSRRS